MRRHWPLLVLVAVGVALIFTNLGRDHLWEDEGDTAVLASTILKTGLPKAWDGVTFTESDHGERLTRGLVMVSHPWAQYYVVAASFALFGESPFAARLPFALAGLATVVLVYVMTLQATGSRRAAVTAAALLLVSVQFLLYARTSRQYTLHALLMCLLVMQFLRLRSSARTVLFTATALALFHTHPAGLAAVGALAALTLLPAFATQRPWVLRSLPILALGTVPWMLLSWSGYNQNMRLATEAGQFAARWLQFLVEIASVAPVIGIVWLAVIARLRRGRVLDAPASHLFVVMFAVIAAQSLLMAIAQPRNSLWVIGVRYVPVLLPFSAIAVAMLIQRVASTRLTWVALVVLFAGTTVGRVTPWVGWSTPTAEWNASAVATFHVPRTWVDRLLRTSGVAYLTSLVHPNPGTLDAVVAYLSQHAGKDDIVVTNYEWDPLYFHTRLPQGLKIAQSDASYEAARAQGLPEYVFDGGPVRWIVWRPAWGSNWGQNCAQLLDALLKAGVPVNHVATLPETLWENRENVHFRRYPGNRYIYPWYDNVPDAMIFRVDWPGRSSATR